MKRLILILGLLAAPAFGQYTIGQWTAATAGTGGSSTAATPTFSPVAGTYSSTRTVTISTATGGAVLCYTTDGTTPTETANLCSGGTTATYSTPITVSTTQTVKAIATLAGYTDSSVGSALYTISAPTLVHYYAGYSTSLQTAQTLGFTTTAGDFIVVGFMGHTSGPTGATASGHALTLAGNNTCGSGGCLYLFFLPNAAAVSQFQSSSSASYATAFFFAEFSGVSATAAVSGTCGIGLSTNASISTWTAPASHTAVAGELVISANEMYYGTSSTITSQTATSPWILFDQYNATAQGVGGLMEYQSNVSPGTYTGGGTASPAVSGYLGTVTCGFI